MFSILTTVSGRSAAAMVVASSILIMIGRKSRQSMDKIRQHIIMFFLIGCAVVYGIKSTYQYLAVNDWLGHDAREKYERQTRGGGSMLQLLMGGRGEFFIGFLACLESPVVGYGPWAIDKGRYHTEKFLLNYGTDEDFESYQKMQRYYAAYGIDARDILLPTHSCLVGFWAWYGIFGLIFWIYVLYLIFQLFRKYISTIPSWYGYFACAIPPALWNIFFSPFAGRILWATLICAILIARAVSNGKIAPGRLEQFNNS